MDGKPEFEVDTWKCHHCGKTHNSGMYIYGDDCTHAVVWCACGAVIIADINGIKTVHMMDK